MLDVINRNRTIFESERDKVNAALILYKNLKNTSMQDETIVNDDSEGVSGTSSFLFLASFFNSQHKFQYLTKSTK